MLGMLGLGALPLAGISQPAAPASKTEYFDTNGLPVATRAEAATWVETIYQDSTRAVRVSYCMPGKLTDSTAYSNVRLRVHEGARTAFHYETGEVKVRERYHADTLVSRLTYHEGGKLRRRELYDRRGQRTLGKVFDQSGKEVPFCEYQVIPIWPGGFPMFTQQVSGRVKYPLRALRNNEQGRVLIGFIVNKAGRMENVHCLNPGEVSSSLREEAEEKVRTMPKRWTNGLMECEPVPVSFTVPVTFRIQ
jgi:protein TonB